MNMQRKTMRLLCTGLFSKDYLSSLWLNNSANARDNAFLIGESDIIGTAVNVIITLLQS